MLYFRKQFEIQQNVFSVKFEVFTAETMKNAVFWDVKQYFFAACVG
jgi:hypothetical protein